MNSSELISAQALLTSLLKARLNTEAFTALASKRTEIENGASDKTFFTAFSMAMRFSGKALLNPNESELTSAQSIHAGWNISDWTCDMTARASLIVALHNSTPADQASARLLALHQTADLNEHIAIAKSLFLMPSPEAVLHIAREGIRSNMRSVFEAICQHNPYPAQYFDEVAWNQMVVKCLFVDIPLRGIYGLDKRANPTLAQILVDLAKERWAASRPVSPEMWRCVGPFADGEGVTAMKRALGATPTEARGAALGLSVEKSGVGKRWLEQEAPDLLRAVTEGRLTWENYDHV